MSQPLVIRMKYFDMESYEIASYGVAPFKTDSLRLLLTSSCTSWKDHYLEVLLQIEILRKIVIS